MDAELPDVYSTETPKARKTHRCCECDGTIQPGEPYHKVIGLWDGRWRTYKTCADCEALRNDYGKGLRCEDWPAFGELCQDVFECRDAWKWVTRYMDIRRKRGVPPSRNNHMENAEREIMQRKKDEDEKAAAAPPGIVCGGREDEMVFMTEKGKHAFTLFTSCPEQGADFLEAFKDKSFETQKEWQDALWNFRRTWTSKYPDED